MNCPYLRLRFLVAPSLDKPFDWLKTHSERQKNADGV